jgi:DNA-binding HxlR family transcriptional regulator
LAELDPVVYQTCDSPYACAAAPIIAKKWFPVIVCHLLRGPKRYSELGRAIPSISGKVLAENLEFMEGEQILSREVRDLQPVEVWYRLTEKGMDLAAVIDAMNLWGERWLRQSSSGGRLDSTSQELEVIWDTKPSFSRNKGNKR